ncbi:NAD(P)/FAD-dependent oxidoreductase [Acidobacteriota bacterium]
MKLKNGSRIAVIGGGPAGSFFAHFALKYAHQAGLDLRISIFDGKDFLLKGPKGCNLCAGIISNSLLKIMEDEGIYIPESRIVNRLGGYILHFDGESLFLSCEENKIDAIPTVFRGNGPATSAYVENISFDDFLQTRVKVQGVEFFPQPVLDVTLPSKPGGMINLAYGSKESPDISEYDLVVGAFGVNAYFMRKMSSMGFGYVPPKTLLTYQTEIKLGQDVVEREFGNTIHLYLPKAKSIRYATAIPKGNFISVTLVGKKDATSELVHDLFSIRGLEDKIQDRQSQCFCLPKIVYSDAKRPFTDGLLIIGDAGFSRLYKNGIRSAFTTARLAAEAAVFHGIDARSLDTYYDKRARKIIHRDNQYGKVLFWVGDLIKHFPSLTKAHLSLAEGGGFRKSSRRIRQVLWYIFTGNLSYKEIYKIFFNFSLQISWLLKVFTIQIKKIRSLLKKSRKPEDMSSTPQE